MRFLNDKMLSLNFISKSLVVIIEMSSPDEAALRDIKDLHIKSLLPGKKHYITGVDKLYFTLKTVKKKIQINETKLTKKLGTSVISGSIEFFVPPTLLIEILKTG